MPHAPLTTAALARMLGAPAQAFVAAATVRRFILQDQ